MNKTKVYPVIDNQKWRLPLLNSAVGDAYAVQAYFLGAAYAAPRKIKFPTELQKNRFFNFNLEKK